MADIEIHDSDVSITLVVDPDALRQMIREELAPLKGQLMTQSSQIHDVAAMVQAFTGDALARFDRLQQAIDSPSDASTLSTEAQAELTGIRNILTAARQAAGLGDENSDGEPAAVPATSDGTPSETSGAGTGSDSGDAASPDGSGDVPTSVDQPAE
jgi:hypothetical protein